MRNLLGTYGWNDPDLNWVDFTALGNIATDIVEETAPTPNMIWNW
jgi:hypothetical protein